MDIAVIGDYESPEYKILYERVKLAYHEESVIDLSRHTGNDWKKRDDARIADITDSHLVIICKDWMNHIDARHDISEAHRMKKEIYIEYNGGFIEWDKISRR
jgi:hypothetical protein